MNQAVQAVILDSDLLVALGRRAAAALPAGAETFEIPEFGAVAAAIASDRRVEQTCPFGQRWLTDGASYHHLVRLCTRYVMELEAIVQPHVGPIPSVNSYLSKSQLANNRYANRRHFSRPSPPNYRQFPRA